MSVVGRVKGTKNALSLEVPLPIHNVYKRRRFVCVCVCVWGGGGRSKGNLKLLRLSLKEPPPVREHVSTLSFL